MLVGKTKTSPDIVILGFHVIGVYAVLAIGNKCGQSEYQSASGECCPMCNIGSVVYRDCKGDASTTCIPCTPDTYMNNPNGLKQCLPCKICDHGQGLSVSQVCTTIQNTICGILEGYYCNDYTNDECTFALKHKKCQPGQEIKVPGTKISDTVCEHCPYGFYSPLGVNCTKWTDCSFRNEDVAKEGSSVKDVTCKPRRGRYGLIAVLTVAFVGAFFGSVLFLKSKLTLEESIRQVHKDEPTVLKKPVEETLALYSVPEENKEEESAASS